MSASKPTVKWWQRILNIVVEEVGAKFKEQNARIAAVEATVAQFEYKGVWEAGSVYLRSNSVTDGGSLWICVAENSTRRPGDNPDWKLACKRGRDGRDARP